MSESRVGAQQEDEMPRGDDTKTVAFKLWTQGESLKMIQDPIEALSDTQRGSVRGWILDWERCRQKLWTPHVDVKS